jgi:hypothetical protein
MKNYIVYIFNFNFNFYRDLIFINIRKILINLKINILKESLINKLKYKNL